MKLVPRRTILHGDATARLRELPSASVDAAITSPPYFGLRDYGVAQQIGLEPDVSTWVRRLRPVFAEVARVLKPTGTLWLNLDDGYSRSPRSGVPTKGMHLGAERLLLTLSTDGWLVRNRVIWAKTNALPRPMRDRVNHVHEAIYLLARSADYVFDLDAIREPVDSMSDAASARCVGRDPGDVWTFPTHGFRGHVATFPPALITRPLLASCPERLCTRCDRPWRRPSEIHVVGQKTPTPTKADWRVASFGGRWRTYRRLGDLAPDCSCHTGWRPGLALDPFFGAGTVGVVAERLGRDWLGVELNDEYVELAWRRILAERTSAEAPEQRRQAA